MKAVQLEWAVNPTQLGVSEVPTPTPKDGWILIRVEAAGLNHSELVLM